MELLHDFRILIVLLFVGYRIVVFLRNAAKKKAGDLPVPADNRDPVADTLGELPWGTQPPPPPPPVPVQKAPRILVAPPVETPAPTQVLPLAPPTPVSAILSPIAEPATAHAQKRASLTARQETRTPNEELRRYLIGQVILNPPLSLRQRSAGPFKP